MSDDRRVNSCNVASAVSMDCVVTNTSRFACARGAGQLAAKTGEKKTGATRIAIAANIGPIGPGIVRVPIVRVPIVRVSIVRVSPRSQVASMQRQSRPRASSGSAPIARQSSRVLCNAATERPVFLRDLYQVDHHVLLPHTQLRIHVVDDALVKRLLLLDGAPRIQRNLDQDEIFAVIVAQIARADIEGFDRMFGDDLEFIVLRHIDHVAHRVIDDFTDRLSIFDGLTPHEIDANKRHDATLLRIALALGACRYTPIPEGSARSHSRALAPRFFNECLGLRRARDAQSARVEETDLSEHASLTPVDML